MPAIKRAKGENKMNVSREEAIAIVGVDAVKEVETENVDFTNRLTDGTPYNGWTEFAASVQCISELTDDGAVLTMYVYIDSNDLVDCEDLSNLDWDAAIAGAIYTVDQ
jgi:hypothetical protein